MWNEDQFLATNLKAWKFNYMNANSNKRKLKVSILHIRFCREKQVSCARSFPIIPFVFNQESKDSVRLLSCSPQRTCLPPCSAPSRTCPQRPGAEWAWPEIPGPPGAAAGRCSHTPPQPADAQSPAGSSTDLEPHWNEHWPCVWLWVSAKSAHAWKYWKLHVFKDAYLKTRSMFYDVSDKLTCSSEASAVNKEMMSLLT